MPEERILFANNAAMRLLDLNPATMFGRAIWEAVRHPQLQDLVRDALSGEQPPRLEFDVARTQSTVAATVSPLPGQPVPGAVMVLHDVTELRRLESLRREFVQNVSHELKTPLSSIAAYADTLLEGGLDDPQNNRQFVERIAEQSDRLHILIMDLLARADGVRRARVRCRSRGCHSRHSRQHRCSPGSGFSQEVDPVGRRTSRAAIRSGGRGRLNHRG